MQSIGLWRSVLWSRIPELALTIFTSAQVPEVYTIQLTINPAWSTNEINVIWGTVLRGQVLITFDFDWLALWTQWIREKGKTLVTDKLWLNCHNGRNWGNNSRVNPPPPLNYPLNWKLFISRSLVQAHVTASIQVSHPEHENSSICHCTVHCLWTLWNICVWQYIFIVWVQLKWSIPLFQLQQKYHQFH